MSNLKVFQLYETTTILIYDGYTYDAEFMYTTEENQLILLEDNTGNIWWNDTLAQYASTLKSIYEIKII